MIHPNGYGRMVVDGEGFFRVVIDHADSLTRTLRDGFCNDAVGISRNWNTKRQKRELNRWPGGELGDFGKSQRAMKQGLIVAVGLKEARGNARDGSVQPVAGKNQVIRFTKYAVDFLPFVRRFRVVQRQGE